MKILQVTCDLNLGSTGVLTTVEHFARALVEGGHEVTTVSFDRRNYADSERMRSVVSIAASRLPILNRYGWSPDAARGKYDPLFDACDGVLIHSLFGHHFTWAARRTALQNIPAFVVPHGALRKYTLEYHGLRKRAWLRSNKDFIERRATFILSSEYEYEQCHAFVKPFESVIIGWPVDRAFQNSSIPPEFAPRTLVMVGRVHPMKRPLETIRAFLRTRGDNWRLVIVGPTSPEISEDDMRQCAGQEWGKAVVYAGAVHPSAVAEFYRAAEGIVLFSRGENFANVVAEAMCLGRRAFISTDVGVASAVRKGECGKVYAISSEQSLDDAFRDVYKSSELTLAEATRIAEFSRKEFSFAAFTAALSGLVSRDRCSQDAVLQRDGGVVKLNG